MADRLLLEAGVDAYQLEDGSGVLTLEGLVVSPALLGGGSLFSPVVHQRIAPGLIAQVGVLFSPTVKQRVTFPLIGPSGVVFQPSPFQFILFFTPIVATGTTFAPSFKHTVAVPLISGHAGPGLPLLPGSGDLPSSQVFAPRSVSAPAVHAPPSLGGYTIFEPTLAVQTLPQTVSVDTIRHGGSAAVPLLLSQAVAVYAFNVSIGAATVGVATLGGGTLFEPTASFTAGVSVLPGRIDQSAVTFAPSLILGTATVSPARIDQAAVLYGMAVVVGGSTIQSPVTVGGGFVFAPQVNLAGVASPFIGPTGIVYRPVITGGSIVIAGLVPIAMGRNLDPAVGSGTNHRPLVGVGSNLKPER